MKKYARILLLVKIWCAIRPISYACFVAVISVLMVVQTVEAQSIDQNKIDVDFKNVSLKQALDQVQKKTTFNIIFSEEMIAGYKVSLRAKNKPLSQVLDELLSKTSLEYLLKDNKIIIRKKITRVKLKTPPKSIHQTSKGTTTTT
jgi:type II secretory pathway component GspD/PulD (secretin)